MARSPSKVAKRYAKALIESFELNQIEEIGMALSSLAKAWSESHDFRAAATNPGIPLAARLSVIEEIAKVASSGNSPFVNFSKLVLENGRAHLIPEIAVAFQNLVDELKKRLTLEIASAFDIESSEKESIQSIIAKDFAGLATIEWKKEEKLIGGLKITAGDRLIDRSVAGALGDFRMALKQ
jgi:F-type H+-transporting ATPase subunit delta